jgi:hypothetical protein
VFTTEDSASVRDWEMEQRLERRYEEQQYSDSEDRLTGEPNTLWEDYAENWLEITEFVGLRKPAAHALQLGLFDEEVA